MRNRNAYANPAIRKSRFDRGSLHDVVPEADVRDDKIGRSQVDANALMNQLFHFTKDDFRYIDKFELDHKRPSSLDGVIGWLALHKFGAKDNPCLPS
ncbi:hypothetical protein COOONC_16470 [Cooperia oncophora]